MYSADEASLSHYQLLGSDPGADYAEIRKKYRAAALALHPDRFSARGLIQEGAENQILVHYDHFSIGGSSVDVDHSIREMGVEHPARFSASGQSNEHDQFLRVQKAWEILRDPESRARYDKYLSAQRLAHQREEGAKVIWEDVYIREMDMTKGREDQTVEYTYPCRCGDYFVVSLEELKGAGYIEGLESGAKLENGAIAEQFKLHTEKGFEWQQNCLVLPCQSCSLHIRLHLVFQSA